MPQEDALRILERKLDEREREMISSLRQDTDLLRFEILYSALISKGVRERTLRGLKEQKKVLWSKAVKMAGGDRKKAIAIYDSF